MIDLKEIKSKFESLSKTKIKHLNKVQGCIVRDVAYMTPETMMDLKNRIGANRVYATNTPFTNTEGVIQVLEWS